MEIIHIKAGDVHTIDTNHDGVIINFKDNPRKNFYLKLRRNLNGNIIEENPFINENTASFTIAQDIIDITPTEDIKFVMDYK